MACGAIAFIPQQFLPPIPRLTPFVGLKWRRAWPFPIVDTFWDGNGRNEAAARFDLD
jgi:hypothetical protein